MWNLLKYEFNSFSFNGTVKVPLFQNSHFEIYNGMSWEITMHWCYFILALNSNVKFVSTNSFVQTLSCLSYVGSRRALLADDGIHITLEDEYVKATIILCVYLLGHMIWGQNRHLGLLQDLILMWYHCSVLSYLWVYGYILGGCMQVWACHRMPEKV